MVLRFFPKENELPMSLNRKVCQHIVAMTIVTKNNTSWT